MELPQMFLEQMKDLLGPKEYQEYINSFDDPKVMGIRVNTSKISTEGFEKIAPFPIEKIPFIPNGYYYEEGYHPSKHPYYFAGLYYIQEPSAMIPASQLPVRPGDKVLDLCAAPGGKATQLGALLEGKGLLVANDISHSRAKGLLKNIELHGIKNALVVSEEPKKLSKYFPEYFDKILIDAPCSGEGMFRKDSSMVSNWVKKGPDEYSVIQKEIVSYAVDMLCPGGYLLYSTCTFSRKENEETIQFMLDEFPELEIVEPKPYEGFLKGYTNWMDGDKSLEHCIRIFPHKIKGEGHFISLLKKKERQEEEVLKKQKEDKESKNKKPDIPESLEEFLNQLYFSNKKEGKKGFFHHPLVVKENKVYLLPEGLPNTKGLRFLRTGLLLGEIKKYGMEPSQALAMSLKKEDYPLCIDLDSKDERVMKYLKGETIDIEDLNLKQSGWYLVCVSSYPLGWAKIVGGGFRNKYYAGWRWQS
ncbi:MAG TPA: RsmB/NOP family class I SAM-dependent RNA methyltransferase [Candidatus Merdenecus merdavium]|nr:RsmB/NOP family class I SAM-dependent RNA methyltransferase [Candidatus Merdenecus merdavium]